MADFIHLGFTQVYLMRGKNDDPYLLEWQYFC